jgi:hypothetical protein
MADVERQPLPALWPEPAVWTDVGELILLVFTQDGVPTWGVSRKASQTYLKFPDQTAWVSLSVG